MITIHEPGATDFSTMGLGALNPQECMIEEQAGGMYELSLTQPVLEDGRHALVDLHRIIKADAPVRETPLADGEGVVTRKIYRVNRSKLKLRTKASFTAGKVIKQLKRGRLVAQTGALKQNFMPVATLSGGTSGWMDSAYLSYVEDRTENMFDGKPSTVIAPTQAREQLFRIYQVNRGNAGTVEALAQHISYDLKGVTVKGSYKPKKAAASAVCQELMARGDHEHEFNLFCAITKKITADYSGRNILDCLLDPEDGVAAQTKARIVRDNYDIYILPDKARSRGVEIRYGKNLLSAELERDCSDIVTRIQPVGKTKKGNPLYITSNNGFVDSPKLYEYPVIYTKTIEYDVAEGEDGMTQSQARTKLRELAQEEFETGIDSPSVGLNTEFVRLELSEQYAELANQYALHLYDSVPVVDAEAGILATVRMTGYKYSSLGGGRYTETTLGDLVDLKPTVYGFDIASGSVSGTRLIGGSIDGTKLRDLAVSGAKIDVDAIETDHLSAGSINADKIQAGSISTDHIQAKAIKAGHIDAEQIETGHIKTGALDAVIADIALANIKTANIDFANVKDLTSDTALISKGAGGEFFFRHLQITGAQVVELDAGSITAGTLSVERLVITGGTKSIVYTINEANGTAQLSGKTIDGGALTQKTITGEHIIGKTITGGHIAGETIKGEHIMALAINSDHIQSDSINASHIKAGEITADKIKAGSIGATNLIKNGQGFFGTSGWSQWGAYPFGSETIPPESGGGGRLYVQVPGGALGHLYQDIYGMQRKTKYTLTLVARSSPRSLKIGFGYKASVSDPGWTQGAVWTMPPSWFHRHSWTFETPDQVIAVARINIQMQNDTAEVATLSPGNMMLQEGEMYTGYAPHPSEVKDGVVAISGEGIEVAHNDMPGVRTALKRDGLRIYENDNLIGGVFKLPAAQGNKVVLGANAIVDPNNLTPYSIQAYTQPWALPGPESPAIFPKGSRSSVVMRFMHNSTSLGYIAADNTGADAPALMTIKAHGQLELSADHDLFLDTPRGLYLWAGDNYPIEAYAKRLRPGKDVDTELGGSDKRWKDIYSRTSSISTSDVREKMDVRAMDDAARDFILALRPVIYKWVNGDSHRDHYGLIAQEVKAAMTAVGIEDFAGYIRSPIEDCVPYCDQLPEDKVRYGLRYEEFVAPLIAAVQAQQRQIEALETRVTQMEAILAANGGEIA